MTIPRIDLLIRKMRKAAGATDYGDDYGIDDEFFVGAIRNATIKAQTYLIGEVCEVNAQYEDIQLVAGQEAYDLPRTIVARNMVYRVWFSPDGTREKRVEMQVSSLYGRGDGCSGEPQDYWLDGNQIFLDPIPNNANGVITLRFEALFQTMDLRRGQITSTTGTLPAVLTISLDSATVDDEILELPPEYICIVDRDGNILMRNVPIASYNNSTKILTVEANFAAEDGETMPVGAYIVGERDCSTHAQLDNCFEPYFIEYAKAEKFELDSSTDTDVETPKLDETRKDILKVYEQMPSGSMPIPLGRNNR